MVVLSLWVDSNSNINVLVVFDDILVRLDMNFQLNGIHKVVFIHFLDIDRVFCKEDKDNHYDSDVLPIYNFDNFWFKDNNNDIRDKMVDDVEVNI